MSHLPVLSGRECVQALERAGVIVALPRGRHISMVRENPFAQVVVPDHRELDRGTLRAIIRQAGLSVEEFLTYLK